MSWALKGLDGPLKNKIIPLSAGLTLGRQAAVVVADVKASSIHARITQGQGTRDEWYIEDNSSKNGTRIKGERITRALLSLGVVFYIGDQGFEVITVKPEATSLTPPTNLKTGGSVTATIAQIEGLPPQPPRYWNNVLAEFLGKYLTKFTERKCVMTPLDPALVLEFIRGVQVTSKWVLGYGPRRIGASSVDLPIWEPGAPAICFEVFPSTDGIVFKTKFPDQVTLNGQKVDSQVLRVGDSIRINETIIEVDFTE
jgi:hypothetical protein